MRWLLTGLFLSLLATTLDALGQASMSLDDLLRNVQGDDKQSRMRATQELVWYHKQNPAAIDRALSLLQGASGHQLSGSGRINLLYYLSGTFPDAWDARLETKGRTVLRDLQSGAYGPQTKGYIADFADTVDSLHQVAAPSQTTAPIATRPQPAPTADSQQRGAAVSRVVPLPGLPAYSKRVALLLGVSRYDDPFWADLRSVPDEVRRLGSALQTRGFEVDSRMDLDSEGIRQAIQQFIDRYGIDDENNQLLFFFAGHGHTRTTRTGIEKGYIVPRDTPPANSDRFMSRAISMEQVTTWAKEIEAKHALFVFDSCFAGSIFETRGGNVLPPHIRSKTEKPVRYFITSGSAGELVPARSSFIDYFIDALDSNAADRNRDLYTTSTELGDYLHEKVLALHQGQTPQHGKILDSRLDDGDFVFFPGPGQFD